MPVFLYRTCLLASLIIAIACNAPKNTATAPPAEKPHEINQTSSAPIGLGLGNRAPEINELSPQGTSIALSSLRGKVVLIDFWASWCGPCRYENPTVVKAYHRFKDSNFKGGKGFTVYSVSLDANADAWKKAIEKDGLVWPYHVSDLKGWNCVPAARYNVSGIPANFLVNDQGIIINKNLRGEDLINALEKLELPK